MFSTLSEGDAETQTRVVYLVGVISGRVEEGRWSRAGGGGRQTKCDTSRVSKWQQLCPPGSSRTPHRTLLNLSTEGWGGLGLALQLLLYVWGQHKGIESSEATEDKAMGRRDQEGTRVRTTSDTKEVPWSLSYRKLWATWHRCWNLNSDPLQEYDRLVTTKPYLQVHSH